MQCVIIISTHKGIKNVFPIGAPTVYRMVGTDATSTPEIDEVLERTQEEEPDDPPLIEGGKSVSLCEDIKKAILSKLQLPSENLQYLSGECFFFFFIY